MPTSPGAPAQASDDALFGAMSSAEDRRPTSREGLAPLLRGLEMANAPAVQVEAARGLGRLENPAFIGDLVRLMDSPVPAVRAEAANAIGQAAKKADYQLALDPLLARARVEQDPLVRGVLARTIGRLGYASSAQSRPAEEAIVALSWRPSPAAVVADFGAAGTGPAAVGPAGTGTRGRTAAGAGGAEAVTMQDAEPATLFGVAHGLASIARRLAKTPLSNQAIERLRELVRYGRPGDATIRDTGRAPGRDGPGWPHERTASLAQAATRATRDPNGNEREQAARIRRLALSALTSSGDLVEPLLELTASDPDPQVRRLTVVAALANGARSASAIEALALQLLHDASFMVRHEALRTLGRLRTRGTPPPSSERQVSARTSSCQAELAALNDPSTHVVLLAIDQLVSCGHTPEIAATLTALVDTRAEAAAAGASPAPAMMAASRAVTPVSSASGGSAAAAGSTVSTAPAAADVDWHRAAHALVALAQVAPGRARERMARVANDPVWQVRMYAARAAAMLKDRATLEALARDAHDNVRNEAIAALHTLAGHDADAIYLEQLTRDDYQLLRTTAAALQGTPRAGDALSALAAAFIRISAHRSETSRDARMALLAALRLAGASVATDAPGERVAGKNAAAAAARRLEPFLADFDPVVASAVGATLTDWGIPHGAVSPRPLPPVPTPARQELTAIASSQAIVHMASGRSFTVTLFPHEAPTNVARFARQARSGYFDSLTFHRVEPNFVIQGGSPHANEYWGDPRYSRDEVALRSHVRGTIGISTRGRDTGDSQIFINLVDNYRLDHDYTIIGAVTAGMDTVDAVVEGDAIARIELIPAALSTRPAPALPAAKDRD